MARNILYISFGVRNGINKCNWAEKDDCDMASIFVSGGRRGRRETVKKAPQQKIVVMAFGKVMKRGDVI